MPRVGSGTVDDLADAASPRVRHPPTPEASEELICPFRGRSAQRTLAGHITHWHLADGTPVEVLNIIDDHSRLLVASDAYPTTKAADVVASFHGGFSRWGLPASVLTDNGAVFTGIHRGGGRVALEIELARLGIELRHSTPYHPQTCGKVERFHQTLKKWLRPELALIRWTRDSGRLIREEPVYGSSVEVSA